MADPQCMWAHRHGQGDHLKLKVSIRIRKKGDLSEFDSDVFVGARRAGLRLSETAGLLKVSHIAITRVC